MAALRLARGARRGCRAGGRRRGGGRGEGPRGAGRGGCGVRPRAPGGDGRGPGGGKARGDGGVRDRGDGGVRARGDGGGHGAGALPEPTGQAAPSAPQPGGTAAVPDRTAAASDGTAKAPTVGWGSSADLGAPALFVLLRHGETALTPEKRFSGSGGSDPELSPRASGGGGGSRPARRPRHRQDIVASPLLRCRQTAAAIADRLGLDVRIDDGLREADFGAWEGLTFAEVQERYPDDLAAWLASPKAAPTGGESFAAVSRRVAATRDRLTERHAGRTVLLVTHVTPIKTLVRLALGAPPESLFRMELSAASFSAIAYYRDGNTSVRLLNDTSHLR